MKPKSLTAWLLAGAMSIALVPALAAAQEAPAARSNYKAPRAPDGKPEISGVWTNAYITRLERPASFGTRRALTPEEAAQAEGAAVQRFKDGDAPTDPNIGSLDNTQKNCQGAGGLDCGYNSGWKDSGTQVARVGGEPRTSFITSTPNGRIPPRLARATGISAAERQNQGGEGDRGADSAGRNDNPESRSLGERCLMSFGNSAGPVMLPLMYNNNYQFVQTKDSVAILVEMVHDVRVIRIGDKHRTDGVRPWMGDSIGWWEGETLVSETTNFPRAQSFQGAWEKLKVTERFTRVGADRLLYQFKVEDPTVWAEAWGGEYEFQPSKGIVYEYACHEGNYGLEGILAGARAEEAAAATQTASSGAAQ